MDRLNQMLWKDDDFWKKLNQIKSLGKVQIVAWHIFGDNPAFGEGIERAYVRFIGEGDKVVEILAPDTIRSYENYKQWYLIQTALNKVQLQKQPQNKNVPFIVDCVPDSRPINATRQIVPYIGVNWLNGARARLYDHVTPEWLL